MKSNAEKLLDILARLAESETVVTDGINDAYQLAGIVSCELDEMKERIAKLERQAAVGQRAVYMLVEIEYSDSKHCPSCGCAAPDGMWHGHSDNCDLAFILRDAERAGMGVE